MSARRATARRGDLTPLVFRFPGRRRARRLPRFAFAVLLGAGLAWAGSVVAQDSTGAPAEAGIPAAVGFVNDHADKLDEPTRARLEAFLDQVKQKTGAEFAVLIMPSTAPWDPSEYKVRVFKEWGLGRKGENDGLLMLVAIEERQVRFETGYGLEGVLPDGLQSRIFRRAMAPRFREGDWAGGVTAGVLECAARIAAEKGVTLEWDGRELRYREGRRRLPAAVVFLVVVLLVLFIIIMIAAARSSGGPGPGRRRRHGGWIIGPGGFGGLGGGSFGGFGGGGGGFGGGSFGGFGGGASGGGGGGGSW